MRTEPVRLSSARVRRIFLVLTVTRWVPTGLGIGVFTLWAMERGLSPAQITGYLAFQGIGVLLLELPTSGFADGFGYKPVLLVAAVLNVGTALLYLRAHSFSGFALAAFVMGIYRALDSGPLEAWAVDRLQEAEPGADADQLLARESTLIGLAIAGSALTAGLLAGWHPLRGHSALLLPMLVLLATTVLHLVATWVLLPTDRALRPGAALASVRATPAVVADCLRLLHRDGVLAGVVAVELFWVAAMSVFETFQPIRLAELLGSSERAAAWVGPGAAAGWGCFALGAALIGRVSRRIGVARAAIAGRVLNGVGAATMGLAYGPAGLIGAYLVSYGLHGACGPVHRALLHRRAPQGTRATVLSLNSLFALGAAAVVGPLLGQLARYAGTPAAMLAGGLFSVLGALCYLPALSAEKRGSSAAWAR